MGEKLAPMPRYCLRRQIGNLNVHSESVRGAHEARLSCVGSCRMTLRVLFAGALAALPLLVSGALAQTAATPPAATTSSAPSANPASPPAATTLSGAACADPGKSVCADPANQPAATATAAVQFRRIPPAPTEGLVSPFMPQAATPTAGTDSAPSASPSTAAPVPAQAAAPPKPKKVAPPPPPRETALSDDPRPTLQPDTFFATAKASERYSAIVDAGGWPTDIAAIGPGTKGPAVAKLRKRLAIEGDLSARERRAGLRGTTGSRRRSSASRRAWDCARPASSPARR